MNLRVGRQNFVGSERIALGFEKISSSLLVRANATREID